MTGRILKVLSFLLAIVICGCSSGKANPASPEITDTDLLISTTELENTNHSLLGVWNVEFDLENMTSVVESNRASTQHYNITTMLPPPGISVKSFDPSTLIADVDVTVTNPFTFGGYDLRFILYSDNVGHILKNPDNWTNMWDIPEAGPLNAFKAYAKKETGRLFAGQTQHTENFRIFMPAGNFSVQFAIDASFPSNCEEPYMIKNFSHGSLAGEMGATAPMQVDVYDWQDDITGVYLYCPQITMQTMVPFTYGGGNTWAGILTNNAGVTGGKFTGIVVAYSGGLALFHCVTIKIAPDNPVFEWVITTGDEENDVVRSCVSDTSGNIFAAGSFHLTVDFDPGTGISRLTSMGEADSYLAKYNSNRNYLWVRGWGGEKDCYVFKTAINSLGDVYAFGRFWGTVDFDPGPGIANETAQGTNCDVYISKFSSNGTWLWTKVWGGEQYDDCNCIAVSPMDEVYAVTTFAGTADFMPGPGVYELTSRGQKDIAVIKFDSTDTWQWAKQLGGTDNEVCTDIVTNSVGDILMTGGFWDTLDFDPNSGGMSRTPVGRDDAFICQWDSSANCIWVTTIGGSMNENSHAIIVDSTNSICIAGTFGGTVDFDPGSGIEEYSPSGWSDIFVTKYSGAHDYQWTRVFGGSTNELTEAMSTNGDNQVLIAGSYEGLVDFNPGSGEDYHQAVNVRDCFLNVLSSSGGHKYAYTWGGENHDFACDVDARYEETVYVCGYFQEEVDFDPGSGIQLRESAGQCDLFITKFKPE